MALSGIQGKGLIQNNPQITPPGAYTPMAFTNNISGGQAMGSPGNMGQNNYYNQIQQAAKIPKPPAPSQTYGGYDAVAGATGGGQFNYATWAANQQKPAASNPATIQASAPPGQPVNTPVTGSTLPQGNTAPANQYMATVQQQAAQQQGLLNQQLGSSVNARGLGTSAIGAAVNNQGQAFNAQQMAATVGNAQMQQSQLQQQANIAQLQSQTQLQNTGLQTASQQQIAQGQEQTQLQNTGLNTASQQAIASQAQAGDTSRLGQQIAGQSALANQQAGLAVTEANAMIPVQTAQYQAGINAYRSNFSPTNPFVQQQTAAANAQANQQQQRQMGLLNAAGANTSQNPGQAPPQAAGPGGYQATPDANSGQNQYSPSYQPGQSSTPNYSQGVATQGANYTNPPTPITQPTGAGVNPGYPPITQPTGAGVNPGYPPIPQPNPGYQTPVGPSSAMTGVPSSLTSGFSWYDSPS